MTKSINEMTTTERVNWAAGELTLAIGEGNFRGVLGRLILGFIQAGYEKGVQDEREGRSNVPIEMKPRATGSFKFSPHPGTQVNVVADYLVRVASVVGQDISFEFNGKNLTVSPKDTPDSVLARYWAPQGVPNEDDRHFSPN